MSDRRNRPGRVALWVVQLLLFALFVKHGYSSAFEPIEEMGLAWTREVPEPLVRVIGYAELVGAAGLVLPAATRVLPWLTPLAAACLVLVMLSAATFHLARGDDIQHLVPSVVTGVAAGFVAWGRYRWLPIPPRTRAPARSP